jgi:hypothetical protein
MSTMYFMKAATVRGLLIQLISGASKGQNYEYEFGA